MCTASHEFHLDFSWNFSPILLLCIPLMCIFFCQVSLIAFHTDSYHCQKTYCCNSHLHCQGMGRGWTRETFLFVGGHSTPTPDVWFFHDLCNHLQFGFYFKLQQVYISSASQPSGTEYIIHILVLPLNSHSQYVHNTMKFTILTFHYSNPLVRIPVLAPTDITGRMGHTGSLNGTSSGAQ